MMAVGNLLADTKPAMVVQVVQTDDSDAYGPALDDLIDNVIARIRADHTFGCGTEGPIWQAGESGALDGTSGEPISVESDLPQRDKGNVIAFQAINFPVTEMIQA